MSEEKTELPEYLPAWALYQRTIESYYVAPKSREVYLERLAAVVDALRQSNEALFRNAQTPSDVLKAFCSCARRLPLQWKPMRDLALYVGFAFGVVPEFREFVAEQNAPLSLERFREWLSICYKGVGKVNEEVNFIRRRDAYLREKLNVSLFDRGMGQGVTQGLMWLRSQDSGEKDYADFTTYMVMAALEPPCEEEKVEYAGADTPFYPDLAWFRRCLVREKDSNHVDRLICNLIEANRYAREHGLKEFLRGPVTYREMTETLERLKKDPGSFKAFFGTRLKEESFADYDEFVRRPADEHPDEREMEMALALGDVACPPVHIYRQKLFTKEYKDYLIHRGVGKDSARTIASSLGMLEGLSADSRVSLFGGATVGSLRKMVLHVERDMACWELFSANSDARNAFRYFTDFLASHYLVEMPDSNLLHLVRRVMAEAFPGGLPEALDDLAYERFRMFMGDESAPERIVSREQLRMVLEEVCVMDARFTPVYRLPESVMDDALQAEMQTFIDERLAAGAGFVHVEALRVAFLRLYPEHPLFFTGKDAFSAAAFLYGVLKKCCGNTYEYGEGYRQFWVTSAGGPLTTESVLQCLDDNLNRYVQDHVEATGEPVTKTALAEAFDYVTPARFAVILQNQTPSLVDVGKKRYVHCESFGISSADLASFRDLIMAKLAPEEVDMMTQQDIFEAVQAHYPHWFENVCLSDSLVEIIRTPLSCFKIIKALWRDDADFVFNRVGVTLKSKEDRLQLLSDAFTTLAQTQSYFTLDELRAITARHRTGAQIRFDLVSRYAVRLDEQNFISKSLITFDVDALDTYLAHLLNGSPVLPISEVYSYMDFPPAEHPWNPFLLQQYLLSYSRDFVLVHAGFCTDRVTGFIADKAACPETFEDAVACYLRHADFYDADMDEATLLAELIARSVLAYGGYRGLPKILEKMR